MQTTVGNGERRPMDSCGRLKGWRIIEGDLRKLLDLQTFRGPSSAVISRDVDEIAGNPRSLPDDSMFCSEFLRCLEKSDNFWRDHRWLASPDKGAFLPRLRSQRAADVAGGGAASGRDVHLAKPEARPGCAGRAAAVACYSRSRSVRHTSRRKKRLGPSPR